MAILILPIGLVLGWFIRPPRRAALSTVAVGLAALLVLAALAIGGAEVSPLETLVLVVGTPLAALLAHKVSLSRVTTKGSSDRAQPGD
jgi:hypothetical protein